MGPQMTHIGSMLRELTSLLESRPGLPTGRQTLFLPAPPTARLWYSIIAPTMTSIAPSPGSLWTPASLSQYTKNATMKI